MSPETSPATTPMRTGSGTDDPALVVFEEVHIELDGRLSLRHLDQHRQHLFDGLAGAEDLLVGALDGGDRLGAVTAATQPFGVDPERFGVVAGGHHVGRHVLVEGGAATDEGVGADAAELVDRGETAEDHEIADHHVTRQGRVVGEDAVVTDDAVVGNVNVDHEQVAAADPGQGLILDGAAVHGTVLAKDVVVADLEEGALAGVLLVLAILTDGGVLEDLVATTNPGRALDHHMGADPGVVADFHLGTDDRKGADFNPFTDDGRLMDDGSIVNDGSLVDHVC